MKGSASQRVENAAGSSFSVQYNTRRYAARSSHVGSSKTTAQIREPGNTSKCKGKSAALPLPHPCVPSFPVQATPCVSSFPIQATPNTTGNSNAPYTVRFAPPDVVDEMYLRTKLIHEMSLRSYLRNDVIGHIRAKEGECEGGSGEIGTMCQLCTLDLSFTPGTQGSYMANSFPPVAVLPCGHCYHRACLEDIFGTVEPPCITCLDC